MKPRWEGGPGCVFQASGWGMRERRRCLSMVAVGDVAGVEYSLRTEDGSPFETRFDQVSVNSSRWLWFSCGWPVLLLLGNEGGCVLRDSG